MDKLLKEDVTFNPETFITKANNIYVMVCTSIMTDNLKRVDHFVGDELYNKLQTKLDSLNNQGVIQMYDELNVSNTFIDRVEVQEDKYIIKVSLKSKYLDYRLDKSTREYLSGDRNNRVEKHNTLIFCKKKNTKQLKTVRTCPNCGSLMDINNDGFCKFCRKPFSQENYDWVLIDMY